MQKRLLLVSLPFIFYLLSFSSLWAQQEPIKPNFIGTGTYHGLTPPLRDLPVISEEEFKAMEAEADFERNRDLEERSYPHAATALPKGPDSEWQREMGNTRNSRGILMNFNGQQSPYYPPDANGTVGPQYYMQTINTVYAIYDKTTGSIVAGPTNMNQLFSGVTGSNCNDGDPLILYDEQADRWVAVEFSLCNANDRMLMAVSQTNDPTGSWHKYSFDVADTPDYEKLGIWQDGYYMGTNTYGGNDIYVFERSQMLVGGTAQMVGFDNPWRPTTIDGFMCVPPLDNDGPFAPAGEPGLFITINDDAIGGSFDALWIYELDVDWTTPSNSTFDRVQQLAVPAFDSNFGNNWNNITQPGTSQKVDAIPMVIMNRPQYRNFGSYETIVCCHTVDVDATNHAGIRWYELRRTGSDWSVRQSGTFSPDEHNRWMGSVSLNGNDQIGLAYSISSSTEYPGIRYAGQSEDEYAAATGILDIAEDIIYTGTNSQTGVNRWGDYADLSVDPDDDNTFWFTTQYIGSGGSRRTRIASFEFAPQSLTALFSASEVVPCDGDTVQFTDMSSGSPVSWQWTFDGGDPATSTDQNPAVSYIVPGTYDVQLIVSDGSTYDTLSEAGFMEVVTTPDQADQPSGPADVCQGDDNIEFSTSSVPGAASYLWTVHPGEAGTFTGDDTLVVFEASAVFAGAMQIMVQAVNDCGTGLVSDSLLVNSHPGPMQYNMGPDGGVCEGGSQGWEIFLDGSQENATYELFRNDTTTSIILPGYGDTLSFGFYNQVGVYTVIAHSFTCSIGMNSSTTVSYLPEVDMASTPTGPTEECNSYSGTEYSTTGAINADYYIWQLNPAGAGVITGNTTVATVDWDGSFTGTAQITVQGANICGPGATSEPLEVTVVNGPQPAIAGEDQVCNQATGNVYFYSTPEDPENTYFWTITGGNFVTGQGTNQVLVTWTAMNSGSLSVEESSPQGCYGDQTLEVSIFDCTGIQETKKNEVFLYPNPVEDELTLKCMLDKPGQARLSIINLLGQEMLSRKINTDNGIVDITIPTSALPDGTYSAKIVSPGGKVYEGKFVKLH